MSVPACMRAAAACVLGHGGRGKGRALLQCPECSEHASTDDDEEEGRAARECAVGACIHSFPLPQVYMYCGRMLCCVCVCVGRCCHGAWLVQPVPRVRPATAVVVMRQAPGQFAADADAVRARFPTGSTHTCCQCRCVLLGWAGLWGAPLCLLSGSTSSTDPTYGPIPGRVDQ